jgi:sulfate adenylyltransferase
LFRPDKVKEAMTVFGSNDRAHPSVTYLQDKVGDWYLGGPIDAIALPGHHDYQDVRCTYIHSLLFPWMPKTFDSHVHV